MDTSAGKPYNLRNRNDKKQKPPPDSEEDEDECEDECEDEDEDYGNFDEFDDDADADADADEPVCMKEIQDLIYTAQQSGYNITGAILSLTPMEPLPEPSANGDKRPTSKKRPASAPLSVHDYIAKNPRYAYYSSDEQNYYKSLPEIDQAHIDQIEKDVQPPDMARPLRFRVLQSNLDKNSKAVCLAKVAALERMNTCSGEYSKTITWVEQLCNIPTGIYKGLPIMAKTAAPTACEIATFLSNTKRILDETVYGHVQAKDQIIRWMAQWIIDPNSKGCVMGLHGAAGTGKTSLVQGLSRALAIPSVSIALGGAHDVSFLEGHSFTYESATWGRIVSVLIEAKCMNPILVFEEAEKQASRRSDEITSLLMHMTDPAQNTRFMDKYFHDIPLDISRSLQVFTMNDPESLNPILRDRMIMIEVSPYSEKDKLQIAQAHLLPSIRKQFNFAVEDVSVADEVIRYIIEEVEEEAGVRTLRRGLECILSNINLGRLIPRDTVGSDTYTLPVQVTERMAKNILEKMKMVRKRDNLSLLGMYT